MKKKTPVKKPMIAARKKSKKVQKKNGSPAAVITPAMDHTGKYKLTDLIDMKLFQDLQDRLNEIYSFPSAIIDREGNVLTATAWQDICTKFHRKNRDTLEQCVKSDKYINDRLAEANPAVSYRCPHGLVDNATPIIINGVHYGNFFTGQFFLKKPDLSYFRKQAKKYGFDEKSYLAAVTRVPIWSRAELKHYLYFIKGLIAVISETGLKKIREIENREKVEESEERFKKVSSITSDIVYSCRKSDNGNYSIDWIGGDTLKILGYTNGEIRDMGCWRVLVLKEDMPSFNKNVSGLPIGLQGSCELRLKHRNGSIVWLRSRAKCLPVDGQKKTGVLYGGLSDFTKRKNAEDALRLSEDRMRMANKVTKTGTYYFDQKNNTASYSPEFFELYGLKPAEHLPLREDMVPLPVIEEDREAFAAAIRKNNDPKGDGVFEVDFRIRKKDGAIRWLSAKGHTYFSDTDGKKRPAHSSGIIMDITERKRSEDLLRESENRFRTVFEQARLGIVLVSPEFRFESVNPAFIQILGYAEDELKKMTFVDVTHPDHVKSDRGNVEKVAKGILASYQTQKRYVKKNDDVIWANVTVSAIRDSAENLKYFLAIVEDITERKTMQDALKESNNLFQTLSSLAPVGIYLTDPSGKCLYANPSWCKMAGLSADEALGDGWVNGLHPDDRSEVLENWQKMVESKGKWGMEYRFMDREGNVTDVYGLAAAQTDPTGKITGFVGVNVDITERKALEKQLHRDLLWSNALANIHTQSQTMPDNELFRFVLDQAVALTESAIGFFHLVSEDQETVKLTLWNEAALKGCSAVHDDHYPVSQAGNWVDCVRTKKPVIYNDFPNSPNRKGMPAGHAPVTRFMSIPVVEGNKVMVIFGVGNKVSAYDEYDSQHLQLVANDLYKIMVQRKNRKELEESTTFSRQIIRSARDGVVVYGKDLRYLAWSPFMEELTGLAERDVIGKHPLEVVPFINDNGVFMNLRLALEGQMPPAIEFQFHMPLSGKSGWASDLSSPLIDANGNTIGVIGIVRDISERKASEEAVRVLNERYNLATMAAKFGIWDWDIVQNVMIWDDRMLELYGLTKETFPGGIEAWMNGLHPLDRDRTLEENNAALRGEKDWNTTFRVLNPDGKVKWIKAMGIVIRGPDGKPLRELGVNTDITDLIDTQESLMAREEDLLQLNHELEDRVKQELGMSREKDITLLRQSRLAAMGEMIHNIAHQWRQPLNNLGILIQNLKDRYDDKVFPHEELGNFESKSMNLIMHMSRTIDDFRNFFKPDKEAELFRLSDSVRQTLSIIEASYKNNYIDLVLELDDAIKITGYPNELSQVLLNIMNNSKEASAERKTAAPKVTISVGTENGRSFIAIGDNAGGIPEQDIDKIFAPYYTTKEMGSGIGLYMSKTIIEKNMGGKLTVRNTGEGLEVRIEF